MVDEADRMADLGFLPAVQRILDATARHRQTLLFSATLDGDVAVLSRNYQHNPVRHETGTVERETIDARHHFWLVQHHDRIQHAADLIGAAGRSIVFTRTRHGADRLARQLSRLNVVAVALHGGRSQNQRNRALREFATGRAQALIATDVAARGIHIEAVVSVIHFDPPADHKDYLHRSGRTARAGASGTVVSLVTPQQRRDVQRMQRDLDLSAPISEPRLDELGHGGYRIGGGDHQGHRTRPQRDSVSNVDSQRRSVDRHDSDRNGSDRQHRDRDRSGRDRINRGRSDRSNRGRANRRPSEPHHSSSNRDSRSNRASRPRVGESVYIANLPWQATDADLETMFGRHGTVHASSVIVDSRSGRSKGFGFVDMPKSDAEAAIKALDGSKLEGRALAVRFAKPRTYGG